MERNRKNICAIDKETEELISGLKIPEGKGRSEVWQSIFERIDNPREVKTVSIAAIFLKIAASVIFIIVFGSIAIWGFGKVDIYAPRGKQLSILLPDDSKVIMNADTRITYNKVFWIFKRKIYMEGESLFKVSKGQRFDVETDVATTSVLGTTFNVYCRQGEIRVSCIEGKVSVESKETNSKVILSSGLETKSEKGIMKNPSENIITNKQTWTGGEFYFNKVTIREVFDEMERQFDIDIFYEGDQNRIYTGYFNNKNLNDALCLICIPMDFDWSIKENLVIIQSKKK